MAFNYDSYIQFAFDLKEEKDEAKLRSAVSRGYYGAYHKTRLKLGITGTQFNTHQKLIENLRLNENIEKSELLANQLDVLKQNRVTADYEPFKSVDAHFVKTFWARLERFLESISEEE